MLAWNVGNKEKSLAITENQTPITRFSARDLVTTSKELFVLMFLGNFLKYQDKIKSLFLGYLCKRSFENQEGSFLPHCISFIPLPSFLTYL
jgi:hypothetical protein